MPSRRSDDRKAAVSPWRSIGEAAEQVIKGLASSRPPLQPDEAPAGDDNAAAEIMANVAEGCHDARAPTLHRYSQDLRARG